MRDRHVRGAAQVSSLCCEPLHPEFGARVTGIDLTHEYVATGANYFVCGFQWGDLTHEQAMQSVELFVEEIMPHYSATPDSAPVG